MVPWGCQIFRMFVHLGTFFLIRLVFCCNLLGICHRSFRNSRRVGITPEILLESVLNCDVIYRLFDAIWKAFGMLPPRKLLWILHALWCIYQLFSIACFWKDFGMSEGVQGIRVSPSKFIYNHSFGFMNFIVHLPSFFSDNFWLGVRESQNPLCRRHWVLLYVSLNIAF